MKDKLKLAAIITAIVVAIVFLEVNKGPVVKSEISDEDFPLAPEIRGINSWINSEPLSIQELKGKVVLIDFWTYSCINCIRTLPYLTAWDEKYRDNGLVIIGLHSPEFQFEKKFENVQNAVNEHGINFAVALDNDFQTWRAYGNHYWPHKYLIDKDGRIRYDHIGEGAYEETEKQIQELLSEIDEDVESDTLDLIDSSPRTRNTPELYLGSVFALPRGQNIGNEEGLQPGREINYVFPEEKNANTVYLEGLWYSGSDEVIARSEGRFYLKFMAKNAYFVGGSDSRQEIIVIVDGKESTLTINEDTLYTAYSGTYGEHELEVKVKEGFRLNSFTFG